MLSCCCCGGVGVEEGGPTGGVEFLLPEPPAMISSVMSRPPWLGSRIRIWDDAFFSLLAGGGCCGVGTMMGGEGGYTVCPG